MSGDVDLLGLYWTTSGPVDVHYGREWSLFDLRDRCAQAARVGFAGIGLWHADLEHVLETRTLTEIAGLLDEYGLGTIELEFLMDRSAMSPTTAAASLTGCAASCGTQPPLCRRIM